MRASGSAADVISYARFCFSPVLAEQTMAAVAQAQIQTIRSDADMPSSAFFNSPLTCGSPNWNPALTANLPQSDVLPQQLGTVAFTIVPRSAYGVFGFLGSLVRMEREHTQPSGAAYISANRLYAENVPVLITMHNDPLLTILQQDGGDCSVKTNLDRKTYCVPEKARTTKQTIGLLTELVKLNHGN